MILFSVFKIQHSKTNLYYTRHIMYKSKEYLQHKTILK